MRKHFLPYWFQGFDQSLAELDETAIDTLMAQCGRACSDYYPKKIYMEAYRASDSLDAFIQRINDAFAEMAMRRIDADTIEVVYTHCACDLVRDGYVHNPKLCICSLKNLQYNWEAVLGEGSVECTLEQSILDGSPCCRFIVKLVS